MISGSICTSKWKAGCPQAESNLGFYKGGMGEATDIAGVVASLLPPSYLPFLPLFPSRVGRMYPWSSSCGLLSPKAGKHPLSVLRGTLSHLPIPSPPICLSPACHCLHTCCLLYAVGEESSCPTPGRLCEGWAHPGTTAVAMATAAPRLAGNNQVE